ncbi:MAG: hypothetical protein JWM43_1963 [Acidobacteriaceae bacterium]|nr:hypothetical protein [Acidobacteriaceae bacterium]
MKPSPSHLLLAAVLILAAPVLLLAQQPANIGQALNTLADQPATHTGFVFDRSMLQIAQSLLESNGMDAQRATAAIHSIAVDSYHYPQPAFYTPEAFSGIVDTFRVAGWKHLVNANQTPANSAQPRAPITDLWLHFAGADIDGVTVLTRASRDMNVIQLSCDLRPLDLLHLSGHFGIPKVDPNAVMVPTPDGR